MSLGLIIVIILVIFLLGGFSGRFGGPGYGYGHRGNGLIGIILIIVVILRTIFERSAGIMSCAVDRVLTEQ